MGNVQDVLKKVRGFVFDQETGEAMPYVVVVVSMARVGGPTVALKRLATDQAGYFAFDLTGVLAKLNLAEISAIQLGVENAALGGPTIQLYARAGDQVATDLLGALGTPSAPLFQMPVNAASKVWPSVMLTAIESPDEIDRQLVPGSFTQLPSGTAHPTPKVAFRHEIEWLDPSTPLHKALHPPKDGDRPKVVLKEYRQTWYPIGTTLGDAVTNVGLAPGESVTVTEMDTPISSMAWPTTRARLTGAGADRLADTTAQSAAQLRATATTIVVPGTVGADASRSRTLINPDPNNRRNYRFFELVRNYRVVTELVGLRYCGLIPYEKLDFTKDEVILKHYRTLDGALAGTPFQALLSAMLDLADGERDAKLALLRTYLAGNAIEYSKLCWENLDPTERQIAQRPMMGNPLETGTSAVAGFIDEFAAFPLGPTLPVPEGFELPETRIVGLPVRGAVIHSEPGPFANPPKPAEPAVPAEPAETKEPIPES